MMLGNGSKRLYDYDMRSQLTTQVELNSSNVPIVTLIDSYDAVGNRMTRSVNGTVATWSYDSLYRLTGQVKPGQVATYTLDGVGNLKTMWEGGSFPKTFTFNAADRLVTMIEGVKVTTYSYTGYGALEIEQTPTGFATHTYSGQDQLVGSVSGSGLTVSRSTYTFGGDGLRRTAQNGNVQPTTMVWDGADYLLLNGPSENQVVLTLGSEIVSCGDFDLLPDSLGSVIGDTRAGFDPRLLYEYWPYGMMSASVIRAMLPFLYVGSLGYYNDSADRDYVRARELMKKTGRWLQVDPLWPGERTFGYCESNPTSHTDELGLDLAKKIIDLIHTIGDLFTPGGGGVGIVPAPIKPPKWVNGVPTSPICIPNCPIIIWETPPPVYGNYCGPQGKCAISPPPNAKDALDKCCQGHDNCWAKLGCDAFNQVVREDCKTCTRTLCKCLKSATCSTAACNLARETFTRIYCRIPFI